MKIFLAGSGWHQRAWGDRGIYDFYRLESYHAISQEREVIHKYDAFMLDSGAFSFMSGKKAKTADWDEYIEGYAAFINKYDVKYFFELDIDVVVGIREVNRLRAKLEALTGKKSIPVWHKSRGLDYWKDMIQRYEYVAIGGIVTKEIKSTEYHVFHKLLAMARKEKCKVHGLGFTHLKHLLDYDFYSVDSTSWLGGNRFGFLYHFNGRTLDKIDCQPNQRLKTTAAGIHNFDQWYKYSKYVDSIT